MQDAGKSLVAFGGPVVGDDALAVSSEDQVETRFVAMAAGEAALVCGFIIEFVGVLHGLRPVYQPIWREPSLDRRSEAIAQLLETALSERFATPVMELLQAMPIPVAVLEAGDLRALAVNELMTRILHRADAAGYRISALVPPAHPLSDPRPFRSVGSSGQPWTSTVVIDGQTWEWFIHPLRGPGRSVEHFLTGLVASPAAPLDIDAARLAEMNAAKTEFLNMAAHELRTPLSVILGYGSMLAQGGLSAEHQKLAGARIYEKTRQLGRLIMDMSLVGRIDELGPSMPREAIDLVHLLEPMVKDQQRRFPDLAIDFRFDALKAPVDGNPYWLRLAIRELLDNAVRFRPGPTGRIDIDLAEAEGNWRISVLDDGFGIDPRNQGQLFKRFARIDTDANRHLVGMGIGLYLVQEVARAHGGQVLVDSRAGAGSEFTLELPRQGQKGDNGPA
jgi:signal transduction histidine kinase